MIMPNTTHSHTETTPRVNPAAWVEQHGAYLHRYAMYRTLNITASNLWVTLHRARKRLRSCMEAKRTGSAGKCCEHG